LTACDFYVVNFCLHFTHLSKLSGEVRWIFHNEISMFKDTTFLK
jgi:hypothetical protein